MNFGITRSNLSEAPVPVLPLTLGVSPLVITVHHLSTTYLIKQQQLHGQRQLPTLRQCPKHVCPPVYDPNSLRKAKQRPHFISPGNRKPCNPETSTNTITSTTTHHGPTRWQPKTNKQPRLQPHRSPLRYRLASLNHHPRRSHKRNIPQSPREHRRCRSVRPTRRVSPHGQCLGWLRRYSD